MSGAVIGTGSTKFKEAFPALEELQAGRETCKYSVAVVNIYARFYMCAAYSAFKIFHPIYNDINYKIRF